jgi:hypothetical protein
VLRSRPGEQAVETARLPFAVTPVPSQRTLTNLLFRLNKHAQ